MASLELQVPSHALPKQQQQQMESELAHDERHLQPVCIPATPRDSQHVSHHQTPGKAFRVGCALLPKKVSRYLTANMKAVATAQGVELVQIDYSRSLLDQGTFDAIVHKLRPNKDWERKLLEYVKCHPNAVVIDSVDGIRALHNRATMLTPLQGQGVLIEGGPQHPSHRACVQAPHQVEIAEGTTLEEARLLLQAANLAPPLLIKPLWTDGREGSHGLAVLHDMEVLGRLVAGQVSRDLQPPLVVQQFVDHGGVLFKVYVLGDKTVVSRRPSLGEKYLSTDARKHGILQLPRISCKSVYAQQHQQAASQQPASQQPASQQPASQQPASQQPASQQGIAVPSQPVLQQTAAAPLQLHNSVGSASGGAAPGSQAPSAAQQQQQLGVSASGPPPGAAMPPSGSGPYGLTNALSTFPLPPEWVTHSLATVLRQRLGLQLFNFDLIRPEQQARAPDEYLYYVIDINYFPGVDKIPNFEHVFVAFLKQACVRRQAVHSGTCAAVPPGDEQHHQRHQGCGDTVGGATGDEGDMMDVGDLDKGDGEPHVEVVEVDDEDIEGSSTDDGTAGPYQVLTPEGAPAEDGT